MGAEQIRKLKEQADEPKPKKYYSIPKVSKKRAAKLKKAMDMVKLDEEFYKEVWLASKHVCQNCNDSLGKVPYNWMFHHLLPKRIYTQFRHTPENIMILCLECHSKAETNIDFAPRIKYRTAEAEIMLLK
jgi:5-methylcytosine-specific restriction endonuclease McrA